MERDVRYLIVGITVAVLVAGLIAFSVWQTQRYTQTDGRIYTVWVEGAVTGLSEGSPVRYLGLRKGSVVALRLSSQDAGRVAVDISLQPEVPVSRTTRARIEPEGVTGASYLSLRTPDPQAGAPPQPQAARHPVIEGETSRISAVIDRMPQLMNKLTEIADRSARLLSDENQAHLASTLARIDQFSGRLNGLAGDLEATLAQARGVADSADQAIQSLEEEGSEVGPALREVKQAAAEMRTLVADLDERVEANGPAIDGFLQRGLPELRALIADLRQTARTYDRLGSKLERNPARLLREQAQGGVEVPP